MAVISKDDHVNSIKEATHSSINAGDTPKACAMLSIVRDRYDSSN